MIFLKDTIFVGGNMPPVHLPNRWRTKNTFFKVLLGKNSIAKYPTENILISFNLMGNYLNLQELLLLILGYGGLLTLISSLVSWEVKTKFDGSPSTAKWWTLSCSRSYQYLHHLLCPLGIYLSYHIYQVHSFQLNKQFSLAIFHTLVATFW